MALGGANEPSYWTEPRMLGLQLLGAVDGVGAPGHAHIRVAHDVGQAGQVTASASLNPGDQLDFSVVIAPRAVRGAGRSGRLSIEYCRKQGSQVVGSRFSCHQYRTPKRDTPCQVLAAGL